MLLRPGKKSYKFIGGIPQVLKRILQAKFFNHRKSSNKLQRTNQSQIRLLVTIRRLRWFGLVPRMYYGCLFKYLLEWHTSHAKQLQVRKKN